MHRSEAYFRQQSEFGVSPDSSKKYKMRNRIKATRFAIRSEMLMKFYRKLSILLEHNRSKFNEFGLDPRSGSYTIQS